MTLYAGKENSPGKMAAREFCYKRVREDPRMTNALWLFGYHFVIASRECGDIKYLLQNGIVKSQIIACDIDKVAIENARQLGVKISPYKDIVDTIQCYYYLNDRKKIASINLDLCKTLEKGLEILNPVLDAVSADVPIMFTFLRGRDNMHSTKERLGRFMGGSSIDVDDGNYFCYQSSTDTSRGSPMCAVVI